MAVVVNVVGKVDFADIEKARKSLERLSGSAQDTAKKSTDGFKKLASGAGTALAGIGFVAWAKSAVNAASDMNETVGKSNVVFGSNAQAVEEWANTAATSMGQSKQQALEAAGTFGNLFVSMKMNSQAASDMSTHIVGLASDLASFNNADPAEVLDALRAGLVGETEPLRRYGINISAAAIQTEALTLGLVKSVKDGLSPAAKAQATYALIMDQTGTAQGDFARTSDGVANSQRIMAAEFADTQAKLGQTLLPILQKAEHILNSVLGAFNAMPAPVQTATVVLIGVGTAATIVIPKVMALKTALAETAVASKASALAGSGAIKGYGLIAIGAGLATKAVSMFGDQSVNAGLSQQNLQDMLADTSKSVDGLGYHLSFLGATDISDFNQAIHTATDPGINNNLQNMAEGFLGISGPVSQAAAATGQVDSALASLAETNLPAAILRFNQLKGSYMATGGSAEEFDRTMVNSSAAINSATAKTTSTVNDQIKAVQSLTTTWAALDGTLSSQAAADAYTVSMQSLTKSLKDNKHEVTGNSAAALANRDAIRQAIGAAETHAKTYKDTATQARIYTEDLRKLRERLSKAGFTPAEVDAMLKPYAKVNAAIDSVRRNAAKKTTLAIQPVVQGNGQIVFHPKGGGTAIVDVGYRARGGPVKAGHPYIVGEEAPELFIPDRPGYIANGSTTAAIASRSGGSSFSTTIQIDARGATADAAPAIRDAVREAMDERDQQLAHQLKAM